MIQLISRICQWLAFSMNMLLVHISASKLLMQCLAIVVMWPACNIFDIIALDRQHDKNYSDSKYSSVFKRGYLIWLFFLSPWILVSFTIIDHCLLWTSLKDLIMNLYHSSKSEREIGTWRSIIMLEYTVYLSFFASHKTWVNGENM